MVSYLFLIISCKMNPKSELILRQQHLFSGRVLLINPPVDDLVKTLSAVSSLHQCDIWTWHYANHQQLLQKGLQSRFAIDCPDLANYNQIIIFNPKAKARLQYLLAYIQQNITQNVSVFLVGAKKGGIEGSAKLLSDYGKAIKLDSARHCQLWQTLLSPLAEPRPFAVEDWIQHYTVSCQDKILDIYALAGVFSQQQLDIGTAQLLPYLSQVKSGKIADFGCGAGVIACYLATLQPNSQIIAYDVDAFAFLSTQMTARANQLHNVQVQAVSGIVDVDTEFDAIVSNPPFHQGIKKDYAVSEQLCLQAKSHLKPNGELWIVANQFLNYQQWLKSQFNHCETKIKQQGFKVLYAQNTR